MKNERIQQVLLDTAITMVFQPISDVATGHIVGVESLARFTSEPMRTPDRWFAEAAEVGLGTPLEITALREASAQLPHLPPSAYLAVNLSPATLLSVPAEELLQGIPANRLVLEVTEHARVDDYDALLTAASVLRSHGVKVAVDDAGAGFSSLNHILRLQPDIIKLDLSLTRDINTDPVRRALAAALVSFAIEIDAALVAEGVETRSELDTLRELGVNQAQGYYLGKPGELSEIAAQLFNLRASIPTSPH